MVAKLAESKSLRRVFYYNQNKENQGHAVCLLAENYPYQAAELSESSRLKLLEKMAALRPSVTTNALHISLNFDPSEQLSDEQFRAIARDYMKGIGFDGQPYLVYRHQDAGHPHMHIVTTNIQLDGTFIPLHKLGIRSSEPTRKAIEKQYGLVVAEEQKENQHQLGSAYAEAVTYGRKESRKAISTVLNAVTEKYKYGTLAELNAVLGLYNVQASRGVETSRCYRHRGLVYQILDHQGRPIGIPIKSSSLPHKPTLDYLEDRFEQNKSAKKQHIKSLRNAIDLYFSSSKSPHLVDFIGTLKDQGISVLFRRSEQGDAYGITFIDHRNRVVFNGSTLGKAYSAKGILERVSRPLKAAEATQSPSLQPELSQAAAPDQLLLFTPGEQGNVSAEFLEDLLRHEQIYNTLPAELRGKKRRKKKKKTR